MAGASVAVTVPDGGSWTGVTGVTDDGDERSAATAVDAMSVTKLFTANLVYRAVDLGLIGLDDPIPRIAALPDLPLAGRVTVRQLLAHRSGLANYRDTEPYRTDPTVVQGPADAVALSLAEPADEPGGTARYSSTNYLILGYLLEQLTGLPFDQLLAGALLEPMGLAHTVHLAPEPGEPRFSTAGIVTDIEDLARAGEGLLVHHVGHQRRRLAADVGDGPGGRARRRHHAVLPVPRRRRGAAGLRPRLRRRPHPGRPPAAVRRRRRPRRQRRLLRRRGPLRGGRAAPAVARRAPAPGARGQPDRRCPLRPDADRLRRSGRGVGLGAGSRRRRDRSTRPISSSTAPAARFEQPAGLVGDGPGPLELPAQGVGVRPRCWRGRGGRPGPWPRRRWGGRRAVRRGGEAARRSTARGCRRRPPGPCRTGGPGWARPSASATGRAAARRRPRGRAGARAGPGDAGRGRERGRRSPSVDRLAGAAVSGASASAGPRRCRARGSAATGGGRREVAGVRRARHGQGASLDHPADASEETAHAHPAPGRASTGAIVNDHGEWCPVQVRSTEVPDR